MKRNAKKVAKPKAGLEKPYNGGAWTRARFTAFVKSALRGARWPQRYEAVKRAFVRVGINPTTGRSCKLHRCEDCLGLFPQNGVQADHATPVVGPEGFTTWDDFISRLFVDADGYRILCKECHSRVTKKEQEERRSWK